MLEFSIHSVEYHYLWCLSWHSDKTYGDSLLMNCSRCNIKVPNDRVKMGYTICVKCSTEEKVASHTIYPHKTGGFIQVVSKEQAENLNRLDRRGYKGISTTKHYKPFKVRPAEKPKVYKSRPCKKVYPTYEVMLETINKYYEEWGYERTIAHLRSLNSSGKIPLMTRVKIQDVITERYLNPSPRALARKYKK